MVNETTVRPKDLHRIFIQSLLSRRAMREDVALELYKRAVGICQSRDENFVPTQPTTIAGLEAFRNDLKELLHDFGMEVDVLREEDKKGKKWIALINTDPSQTALSASDLAPNEIAYYREIIKEIMLSYPANSIGHTAALHTATTQPTKMTKLQAQGILESLVSRGWLSKSKRGRYSLAPRAMMELSTFLEKEYEEEVKECPKCRRLMLAGVACAQPECEAHYHQYCYDALLKTQKPTCMQCRKLFSETPPRPIGEKAISRTQDEWTQGAGKKRKRPRTTREGEEEEDELDVEDVDLEEEEGADGNGSGELVQETDALQPEAGPGPGPGWVASERVRGRNRQPDVVPETQYEED